MFFKNTLFIIFLVVMTNCTTSTVINKKPKINFNNNFNNKGFALIYSAALYKKDLISKKIDDRSLVIFQRNLKINTHVKITNILNNKSLIVRVGDESNYPSFYNSVLSIRIADELGLNINEPYVEIVEIPEDSIFVAKRAKTYDEEKNVATKAPVNSISINNLNEIKSNNKKITNSNFYYSIKIADFYFNDTAKMMIERIINETDFKKPRIKKITKDKYRVYLGPFNNINSLQKSFNDISILEFENIEIIRND